MTSTPFGRRAVPPGPSAMLSEAKDPAKQPRRPLASIPLKTKLFSFQGRLTRQKYWYAQLVFMAVALIETRIFAFLRGVTQSAGVTHSSAALALALGADILLLAVLVAAWWLTVTVVVRRWHDRGKSAAWAALGFLPFIGWLWQGIECGYLEGTLGPNKYGPSPKGVLGVNYAQ